MQGQLPTAESRSLTETIGTTDIDKMLHDYVKPAFIRLSADDQQKAIDYINQLAGK